MQTVKAYLNSKRKHNITWRTLSGSDISDTKTAVLLKQTRLITGLLLILKKLTGLLLILLTYYILFSLKFQDKVSFSQDAYTYLRGFVFTFDTGKLSRFVFN